MFVDGCQHTGLLEAWRIASPRKTGYGQSPFLDMALATPAVVAEGKWSAADACRMIRRGSTGGDRPEASRAKAVPTVSAPVDIAECNRSAKTVFNANLPTTNRKDTICHDRKLPV